MLLVDSYICMYHNYSNKEMPLLHNVRNLRRAVKTNVQALHLNSSSSHDTSVSEPTEQKQTLPSFTNTYDNMYHEYKLKRVTCFEPNCCLLRCQMLCSLLVWLKFGRGQHRYTLLRCGKFIIIIIIITEIFRVA